MIRALVIDDEARAEANRVIAYASQHHYRIGMPTPGDDERFVAHFGDYRAVFTFTEMEDQLWRHLSISVPSKNYPHPAAAFMIADVFGFTGRNRNEVEVPGENWIFNIHESEHCVVIAQLVEAKEQVS